MTTSDDPHKYTGSGTYWIRHLKKYGFDYSTEIIKECKTKEEFKKWGLYYSNLWNIVNSNEWANLKEEAGYGGRQSEEVRKRIGEAGKGRIPWNKGKEIWSESDRQRISNQNKSRLPQSAETIAKRVAKNTGKHRSEEQKLRLSLSQKGRKFTEEHKAKLRAARKKGIDEGTIIPWNKKVN